jgi:hypothetical protein
MKHEILNEFSSILKVVINMHLKIYLANDNKWSKKLIM